MVSRSGGEKERPGEGDGRWRSAWRGRGTGWRKEKELTGGARLEVRGRESGGGRLDWAGVGLTGPCGKEREEEEGRRWIGLEEEREKVLFVFFNSNTI